MRTYSIRHPHTRQKATAIATLRSVIDNLGLGLTIPDEGSPVEQVKAPGRWEAMIGHSKSYVTATINVHLGPKPDLEMAFLDITDAPDRWN